MARWAVEGQLESEFSPALQLVGARSGRASEDRFEFVGVQLEGLFWVGHVADGNLPSADLEEGESEQPDGRDLTVDAALVAQSIDEAGLGEQVIEVLLVLGRQLGAK